VDRLVAAGLVEELDLRASGRAGRPATPVRVARGTMVALGLEINPDYLGARAVDLAGNTVFERVEQREVAGMEPGEALAALAEILRAVRSAARRRSAQILGAGLAVPGAVDRPLGPLRIAPNLGWKDVDIAGLLGRVVRTPLVRLDNEASFAARAELQARRLLGSSAGRSGSPASRRHQHPEHLEPCPAPPDAAPADTSPENAGPGAVEDRSPTPEFPRRNPVTSWNAARGFIYVSGGIGVGAGIVQGAAPYGGAHGWAGELGHVTVYPGGRTCRCGANGCLEQYASRSAVAAAAGLPLTTSIHQLVRLAEAKTPQVEVALADAGTALGIALAGAVNLMDIGTVVLGGDLAMLSPYISGNVTAELRRRVLAARWSGAYGRVETAIGPAYPAMTGAALAVADLVASDPAAYLLGAT
jgi:predicted NBD/HSP70 family sugar kinase